MADPEQQLTHKQRRARRTFRIVMVIAIAALVLRGILFLIEDGAQMSAEEGEKLKPIETHIPER